MWGQEYERSCNKKTSKQVLANELLKMGYAATEKKTQEQK